MAFGVAYWLLTLVRKNPVIVSTPDVARRPQRALKTIEDFTQFEQAGADFDGDHVIAAKKGLNPLDRISQVDLMAEFQEELGFPPTPKLDVFGQFDHTKSTQSELRGQAIFFGKGRCDSCNAAPYYTDNLMHDLKTERSSRRRWSTA
jgi:cytochrome c peroxidase